MKLQSKHQPKRQIFIEELLPIFCDVNISFGILFSGINKKIISKLKINTGHSRLKFTAVPSIFGKTMLNKSVNC